MTIGNKQIMKVDLRMVQPNTGTVLNLPTLHSIEHLLAQHMYDQRPSQIIDVSPMGCLGKGTKVVMFDGSLKEVERVEVGDYLMGPDSGKRGVKSNSREVTPL